MESTFIKSVNIKEFSGNDKAYHEVTESISASAMKRLKISPGHYREAEKVVVTDAMRFGSAYHCYVLQPEVFEDEYYIFDDSTIYQVLIGEGYKSPRSTKDYKAWLESENRLIGNREMISKDEFEQIKAMKDRLMSHRYTRALLKDARMEVGYMGEIETEAGNINVKFKPDVINDEKRIIVDLKTVMDASVDVFTRAAADRDYHLQASFYVDMLTKIFNDGRQFKFFFIAQEKKAPYFFNIFEAGPQFIAQGRYEYEMLLQMYIFCLDNDTWPGYQIFCENKYGVNELKLPAWAIKSLDYYKRYE